MCPISRYQADPSTKLRRINILVFSLLALISGAYLFTMNEVMVRGFRLEELQRSAKALAEEHRDFELQAVSLKSYDNLSQKLQELQMVSVDNIDYISASSALAKK
jgi:hypothetical protein